MTDRRLEIALAGAERLVIGAAARRAARSASRGRDPARSWSAAAPCRARPTIDRAPSSDSRRCAARAGRPGSPSAAVVEHVVPALRSALTVTSCRNALSRSAKSETGRSCSRIVSREGDEDQVVGAAGADRAGGGRVEPPLPVVEQPEPLGLASSRARRRSRRRAGRTRRRGDGRPHAPRQQARGDRKVLVVRPRQLARRRRRRTQDTGDVAAALALTTRFPATPARWLTARAMTKSRSDRRLT